MKVWWLLQRKSYKINVFTQTGSSGQCLLGEVPCPPCDGTSLCSHPVHSDDSQEQLCPNSLHKYLMINGFDLFSVWSLIRFLTAPVLGFFCKVKITLGCRWSEVTPQQGCVAPWGCWFNQKSLPCLAGQSLSSSNAAIFMPSFGICQLSFLIIFWNRASRNLAWSIYNSWFLSFQVSSSPAATEPTKPRPKKGLFEDLIVFLGQVGFKVSSIVFAAV